MNTAILSLLTNKKVKQPRDVIDQGYVGLDTETAGCWIKTSDVNSISSGVVLSVERSVKINAWCVTVEVDSKHWIRYCGLGVAKVSTGDTISKGQLIGFARNNLLRFEYCTSIVTKFPVRLLSKQLYKTDPTHILFGQETLSEVT